MDDKPDAAPDVPPTVVDALIDILDRLRDGLVLQLECAMRDIRRLDKERNNAARE